MGKLSKTSNSQFKQGKKSTFLAKKKGQTGLKSKNHSVHSKNKNLKKIAQNTKKDDTIEAGVKDPGKKKSGKHDMKFKKKKKDEEEEFEVAVAKDQIDEKQSDSDGSHESEDETSDMRKLVSKQNRKKKKSGGFQSMGLSYSVYKGITRKGYKVPTPIQRKTVPMLMDGKDVVAMARTGSGKTAAFLIPMFEKLQVHSSKGARAIILSPTRELALQTMKFTKELGKYTDLKFCLILGGDSMENQFASMHENPDVLIATPGRFLHLLVEMDMKKLASVEYVVFDEADRLFEMGFAEQLQEIITRLPDSRQTLLFSATLPKVLVDFAKAGLNDPELVRLDVDTKISDQLKMSFLLVRPDDKMALLLRMLQTVIKDNEQTVVFVATKHHVEYVRELLEHAGISCSFIYSSLDQTARKINVAKFQKKKTMVLVVTDVAARGIDIPMLDNVINFDFPCKPKLFVHRVGRVARAGRSGNAYSLLTSDELSFVIDLHLFLGRPLKVCSTKTKNDEDGVLGCVPQTCLADEFEYIKTTEQQAHDLTSQRQVMANACKQYIKSRTAASQESIKRSKEMNTNDIAPHPLFAGGNDEMEHARLNLLANLKNFKPTLTVFESKHTKKAQDGEAVMKQKRSYHESVIEKNKTRLKEAETFSAHAKGLTSADDQFEATVLDKGFKDENYISARASDYHEERGFNIRSFQKEAEGASVDMVGDDSQDIRKQKGLKKWDRKRKRFVGADSGNKVKKIRTESGAFIPASYKSNVYGEWMKKNRMDSSRPADDDDTGSGDESGRGRGAVRGKGPGFRGGMGRGSKHNFSRKSGKRELQSKAQMVTSRMKASSRGRGGGRGGGRGRGGGHGGRGGGGGRGRKGGSKR